MEITKRETLIILDWDDTLFPTSWVLTNNLDITEPSTRIMFNKKFRELDNIIYNLLYTMNKLGKVIIITNAMPEWVTLSSSLLRNTNNIVTDIPIISARKDYNKKGTIKEWKKMSFLNELRNQISNNNKINNIISIGDANYEYNALVNLFNVQNNYHDRYLKSVQLMKNPSCIDLEEQLKIINKEINNICDHRHHLDLHFNN
jgi:hypothetical protein